MLLVTMLLGIAVLPKEHAIVVAVASGVLFGVRQQQRGQLDSSLERQHAGSRLWAAAAYLGPELALLVVVGIALWLSGG